MEQKILQIIPLNVKSLAHFPNPVTGEQDSVPVIGLALVEQDGERLLQYIVHGPEGKPCLSPDNATVQHYPTF